jgi:hypothetical protein
VLDAKPPCKISATCAASARSHLRNDVVGFILQSASMSRKWFVNQAAGIQLVGHLVLAAATSSLGDTLPGHREPIAAAYYTSLHNKMPT